jgi:hypothetical protein
VCFFSGIGPGVSSDPDTPEASVPEDPGALIFRVWLIRSLTPPKTELPTTIANRRPKLEKYRGIFGAQRGASVNKILIPWYKD